jgi:DNA polymerase III alpha subunit (gram-positive type)
MALDCETGGLNPKTSDLLTFYVAFLDENFKILDELDLKVKPNEGKLPVAEPGALKVNGINIQEHISNPETITYAEAKTKLLSLIKKHLKKRGRYSNIRPLGQNTNFDIAWVQEHILPKDEWDGLIHYAIIDTKALVDFFKDCQYFPSDIGNLGSVVDYLQIPKRQAHSAKDDTLMTIEVYRRLIDIMKSKKDGGQAQDLISLLESE